MSGFPHTHKPHTHTHTIVRGNGSFMINLRTYNFCLQSQKTETKMTQHEMCNKLAYTYFVIWCIVVLVGTFPFPIREKVCERTLTLSVCITEFLKALTRFSYFYKICFANLVGKKYVKKGKLILIFKKYAVILFKRKISLGTHYNNL